jgi:hypothetical protein
VINELGTNLPGDAASRFQAAEAAAGYGRTWPATSVPCNLAIRVAARAFAFEAEAADPRTAGPCAEEGAVEAEAPFPGAAARGSAGAVGAVHRVRRVG